jgi:hypothetical protein
MSKYKSAIFKHLHEEMQTHLKHGGITPAELADFEKDCFKDAPAPQGGTTRRGTLAASAADPRGRSIK